MNWKKWLSVGLSAVVISFTIFMAWPRVEVRATADYLSLSIGETANEIDLTPPTLDIKFEPSGTHVDSKGNLKIRLDFYPTPTSKSYSQYYVESIDEDSSEYKDGYKGELDKEGSPIDEKDYQAWQDKLPKVWKVTPCLCHFVTVSPDITVDDLNNIIKSYFTGNVTDTIDDAVLRADSAHYLSPYMRNKTETTTVKVAKANEATLVQTVNARLSGYENKAGTVKGKAEKIEPGSIDVGNTAIDRAAYTSYGNTYIFPYNPANADGTLDTWETWFVSGYDGTGLEVATFYIVSTKVYTRDYETIGAVTSGSKQTFTGLSTDVLTNDYCGAYFTAGRMERANTGGSGSYIKNGDNIPCSNASFDSPYNSSAYSLYATGTETASYSLTNSPNSKAFGIIAAGTTYYAYGSAPSNPISDGECTFTITNDSAGAEDIDIKISDFTGGVGWNIAGSVAEDTVKVTAYYSGQNPASGLVLTNADQEFYDGLAASAHFHWDFRLDSPSSFTDGAAKTATITLTATAED
jgi:hypothetical protein